MCVIVIINLFNYSTRFTLTIYLNIPSFFANTSKLSLYYLSDAISRLTANVHLLLTESVPRV